MEDKKPDPKDKAIKVLEDCLMLYMGKNYQITGLLGPDTSFTVSINGPFGKKELTYLSNRFRADAEHIKDGVINKIGTPAAIIESLKEAAMPQYQPSRDSVTK